jgi:hydroxyethylthiazole kinase-like uncharacterized protein yjeF
MIDITKRQVAKWVPTRDEHTYKNKMGSVLCVGGNNRMGGAVIMSASAALYAGAGLVTVASAPENVHALHSRLPEAMFTNMYNKKELVEQVENADVVVLGPGLGRSEQAYIVFKAVIEAVSEEQWLVIDADGLYHLAENFSETKIPTQQTVLTPHLGEWNHLTAIEPPADNLDKNSTMKQKLKATIVLKKNRTEVYIDDEIWRNTAGNPSMATGGMGDTLTGIIASFLGQFENKKAAILSAVYIHSAAADSLAETHYVTLPTHVINYLPVFIKNIEEY